MIDSQEIENSFKNTVLMYISKVSKYQLIFGFRSNAPYNNIKHLQFDFLLEQLIKYIPDRKKETLNIYYVVKEKENKNLTNEDRQTSL